MSFENKNLYHLLGNDVEDDSITDLPVREVVKKNTSSKKADVPPPSVDPAKAKKKTKPTGNEGAIKTKINNKSVPGPSTNPKRSKKPFDRHQSRSGKTDSGKKIKQGWGSSETELDAEIDGAADAVVEASIEGDDGDAVVDIPKQSLSTYFAELQVKQSALDKKNVRKANEGAESKWSNNDVLVKEQEAFFAATNPKKVKAKAAKEKKFLDFDVSFSESNDNSKPFKKGPKKAFSQRKAKPAVNDKNFPSL